MKRKDYYMNVLMPAVEECAELLVMSEAKHGAGIHLSDNDALCAAGHAISSMRGQANPDGKSHATATMTRGAMMVLRELDK